MRFFAFMIGRDLLPARDELLDAVGVDDIDLPAWYPRLAFVYLLVARWAFLLVALWFVAWFSFTVGAYFMVDVCELAGCQVVR